MPALREELALFIEPFFERELIVELGEPIKSGKEATVFLCRAHPRTGHSQLALKVYRPRTHRSFKHDATYRQGTAVLRRGGGNTRQARALRAGSSSFLPWLPPQLTSSSLATTAPRASLGII